MIPDISFWQDDPTTPHVIDFERMAKGLDFVIIRAGQNLWSDKVFPRSWADAKKAGIPRGSYWFYDSRADPKKQAQLWIDTMDGDFGELPLWCDFEDRYGGMFGTWRHWYDFTAELQRLTHGRKQIGIYTGYYYWVEHTVSAGIPKASLDYFKQFPLWIASYTREPRIPAPWINWTLWQFTDKGDGTLYGVESRNIDLNYFNGDAEAFKRAFGVSLGILQGETLRVYAKYDNQIIEYKEKQK